MLKVLRFHFVLNHSRGFNNESARLRFWRSLSEQLSRTKEVDAGLLTPDVAERLISGNFAAHLQSAFRETLANRELLAVPRFDVRFEFLSLRYASLTVALLMSASADFLKFVGEHEEIIEEILESLGGEALNRSLGQPASEFLRVRSDMRRNADSASSPDSTRTSLLTRLVRSYRALIPLLLALAIVWLMGYDLYVDSRDDRKAVQAMQKDLLEGQQKMIQIENAWILDLQTKLRAPPPSPASPPQPSASPALAAPVPTPR